MPLNLRYTVNRSIVIFRYKQPFLDWVTGVEPVFGKTMTLDQLNEDGDGFLLPGEGYVETREEAVAWVESLPCCTITACKLQHSPLPSLHFPQHH